LHDSTLNGTGATGSLLTVAQNYVTLSGDQYNINGFKTFNSPITANSTITANSGINAHYVNSTTSVNSNNYSDWASATRGINHAYGGNGVYGQSTHPNGYAGAFDGSVRVSGIVTAQGFVTNSSRRFKQEIAAFNMETSDLLRLRPVSYRYTAAFLKGKAPSEVQYGLIAEEVAKVYPAMVQYDAAGQPNGVNYQELPVMLLSQVQQQQRALQQQQNTIEALLTRLAGADARLAALEAGRAPGTIMANAQTLPVAPLFSVAKP
jgi:hypothetical protein